MTKVDNLYELIKQKSKEKGRPLKIICDWDEVLQASKAFLLWEVSPKNLSFKEYFNRFWEKAVMINYEHGFGTKEYFDENHYMNYSYIDPDDPNEKINRKDLLDDTKRRSNKVYHNPLFYDKNPFLSIAEDIVRAEKSGLIEWLVIITSHKKGKHESQGNPRKRKKFEKTFGKWSNCRLSSIEVIPDSVEKGKFSPYRWEYVKNNCPDFDIFIDDNTAVLTKTREHFSDRIFILPNYKFSHHIQGENIFHVNQEVSDITDKDFAIAALELKAKQLEMEVCPSGRRG